MDLYSHCGELIRIYGALLPKILFSTLPKNGAFMVGETAKGHAGKMLACLFNTAKELKFKRIEFNVAQNNFNAKAFYFHTDFGKPLSESEKELRWGLSCSRGIKVPRHRGIKASRHQGIKFFSPRPSKTRKSRKNTL